MDTIEITTDKNKKKTMEVVATFDLKDREYHYIVYRELDKSRTYLAKYKENSNDLNTDITEEELKLCEAIVKGVTE